MKVEEVAVLERGVESVEVSDIGTIQEDPEGGKGSVGRRQRQAGMGMMDLLK